KATKPRSPSKIECGILRPAKRRYFTRARCAWAVALSNGWRRDAPDFVVGVYAGDVVWRGLPCVARRRRAALGAVFAGGVAGLWIGTFARQSIEDSVGHEWRVERDYGDSRECDCFNCCALAGGVRGAHLTRRLRGS